MFIVCITLKPIPVTARFKARLYGRPHVWIARSNPTGDMDVSVSCESFVLSGRGLCDGLMTCPEEYCRVCCVNVISKPQQ